MFKKMFVLVAMTAIVGLLAVNLPNGRLMAEGLASIGSNISDIGFASGDNVNVGVTAISSNDKLKDAVVLYVGSSLALANNVETSVEKGDLAVSPFIRNGRTLVPVRFITEKFGATVDWNSSNRLVTINIGGKKIELIVGKNQITVDGVNFQMDIEAEIYKGRTFVPLRQLVESIGKKVFYDRGLIIINNDENVYNSSQDKTEIDKIISKFHPLPTIESVDNLKVLLENAQQINSTSNGLNGRIMRQSVMMSDSGVGTTASQNEAMKSAPTVNSESMNSKEKSTGAGDYSTTNVQVEGVDEADVVKTDGKYIYQVNSGQIIIASAYPAEKMEIMSRIAFDNDKNVSNFNPIEVYVDNDQITVIGTSTYVDESVERISPNNGIQNKMIAPTYYNQKEFTNVLIYDVLDKQNPKKTKEVKIEGQYLSSRKIDSFVYVLTNKNIDIYPILYENSTNKASEYGLRYYDTCISKDYIEKSLSDIRYFPKSPETNYLVVAGIDLSAPNIPANITAYLGAGSTVYASTENLYVTLAQYNNLIPMPMLRDTDSSTPQVELMRPIEEPKKNTTIYKFSLNKGNVTYLTKGEVPGHILNQFSMDEMGKHFRIATTKGNEWSKDGANISTNNMYVLDDSLKITGKIEDIAPSEKIYSVRFMGKRAYMVTFKKVDPLFVIDLSNPENPSILGKLKIPGFSDYLHPYDENHIIGFGKDTVESKDTAYYLGMKMAMFDVTDVENPKQQFVELIGDRGTTSELLTNHKALLFSKERNILAFPVTIMKVQDEKAEQRVSNMPQYGTFEFQGAYIYSIDMIKGFVHKGKITHLTREDYLKSSNNFADYEKQISRILYIQDTFFTLSNKILKANRINDLIEINSIKFKN